MGFARYKDQGGQTWFVDMDGIQHLIRSYVRSKAILVRSDLKSDPQDMGVMGALPCFKLTIVTVRTNYDGLGNQVDRDSEVLLRSIKGQLAASGKNAFHTLVGFRDETVNNNESFREMQVDASQKTNDAVSRVLGNSTKAAEWTKFVRDLSGTVLTVGATFLSGGAALSVIGGASFLKGSFTYEDKVMAGGSTNDAVGAAAVEMSTDLVVGVVGMGETSAVKAVFAPKAAEGAKLAAGVIVVTGAGIDGMSEFVKAAVDGKTVQQGLKAAGMRAGLHMVSAAAGPVFDKVFSAQELEGLSYPVTVTPKLLGNLASNSAVSTGSDDLVKWVSSDSPNSKASSGDSAAWHLSLAGTYCPLADSDTVYVEQHAMRRVTP
jgi:hypothetical protein